MTALALAVVLKLGDAAPGEEVRLELTDEELLAANGASMHVVRDPARDCLVITARPGRPPLRSVPLPTTLKAEER